MRRCCLRRNQKRRARRANRPIDPPITPPAIAPALEWWEVLRFPTGTGATVGDEDEVEAGVGDEKVPVCVGANVLL